MKRIVYVLSALAIMLSVSGELSAQQRGDRQGQGQGQRQGQGQGQRMSFAERQNETLKMLTDSLDLNADQIKKIKALNKAYDTKFTTLREEATESDDRSAMREKMRTFMAEYNKELKTYLTDDQKVKFDKLMENRRNRRPSREGDRTRESRSQRSRGTRGN